MSTLQILINHYQEDDAIVERFLNSLEMQKKIDFTVLLCTDGGRKLDSNFLSKFNLNLQYSYLEHSGVCHTRNIMMDNSTADYVMFADIDDCFHACDGLFSLMEAAEKTGADIVGSPYLVERIDPNKKEYYYSTNYQDTIHTTKISGLTMAMVLFSKILMVTSLKVSQN